MFFQSTPRYTYILFVFVNTINVKGKRSRGSMTSCNEEEDGNKEQRRGRKKKRGREEERRSRALQEFLIAFPCPTWPTELRALTGSCVGARRFFSSHAPFNPWIMCLKTSGERARDSYPGQLSHTTHLAWALVSWNRGDYYKSVLSPWLDVAIPCEWTRCCVDHTIHLNSAAFFFPALPLR